MKKQIISIILCLFVLLSFACSVESDTNVITTGETTEPLETQKMHYVETATRKPTEPPTEPIEPYIFDVPEDFLECERYIGVKLSDLGVNEYNFQMKSIMTEIGHSSLSGVDGVVYISLGWDKNTITEVYFSLPKEETSSGIRVFRQFSKEDRELFCSLAESIYGEKSELGNGTLVFSGLTDYEFRLAKQSAVIQWNEQNRNKFEKNNPKNNQPKENEPAKRSPAIGMTAEEVRNSTWGNPSKINRTETESIIFEQWVYPNHKYIYFQNGVVTSIQS